MESARPQRTCYVPAEALARYVEAARAAGNHPIASFYENVGRELRAAAKREGLAAPRELGPLRATPKISCLMVSRNGLPLVARSLESYLGQSYPHRELIIVRDGPGQDLEAHLAGLQRSDIRMVSASPGATLGAMRNRSVSEAAGEVLCQWDDDDVSHPERLSIQLEALFADGAEAAYLQDHFLYEEATGEIHWVDRGAPHYATLLVRRDALPARPFPEVGPFARAGEDVLLHFGRAKVSVLHGAPFLYLYRRHVNNTVSAAVFRGQSAYFRSTSPRSLELQAQLARLGVTAAEAEREGVGYFTAASA